MTPPSPSQIPQAGAPAKSAQAVAPPPKGCALAGYSAPVSTWDEARGGDGKLRAGWQKMADCLDRSGAGFLERRWRRVHRLIAESALSLHGEEDGPGARVCRLDPMPLLIDSGDWARLRAGLEQRARLLNGILADLYGYQRLLREGILPPEAVYGHPGFLRPCHGLGQSRGVYLSLYAVDLARDSAGNWVVIRDHTQAPGGVGYAMENRLMLLRAFPELYHELQVERLLGFSKLMRENLHGLAARPENPRVVILSPGPGDRSYFEHVYLARHLGCQVVEGSDLTVRDNAVFLKTLGGLLPVDVILRRVEDSLCDPLELQYDSAYGVPGLVQALHEGRVAVANALGTGLLDSPMIVPWLDRLSRTLLGEELLLASAETRWCGNTTALRQGIEGMENLLIKPVHGGVDFKSTWGGSLAVGEREALAARMRENPCDFVTQQYIQPSSTPCFEEGRVVARPVMLRCYVAATADGWEVMPGGVAHVTAESPEQFGRLRETAAKDTWVLSEGTLSEPNLLQHVVGTMPLMRTGLDMPSRVADDLFWLGRYAERTEGSVRCLRRVIMRLTDEAALGAVGGTVHLPELLPLLNTLVANGLGTAPEKTEDAWSAADLDALEPLILEMVESPDVVGNLRHLTRSLHRIGWVMRDRLSNDMWRILQSLETHLAAHDGEDGPTSLGELQAALDALMMPLAALGGLVAENLTHGPGWRFLDMGRRMERAFQMAKLVSECLGRAEGDETAVLQALLDVGDSSLTYRSRYLSNLQPEPVLDLLLLDESNPRSMVYQLTRLANHIESLQSSWTKAERTEEERLALSMVMAIRTAQARELAQADEDGRRARLMALLEPIVRDLPELSDALTRHYFSHADPPQAMDS